MTASSTIEFAQFKAKREAWVERLSGKDPNAIRNQVTRMIWEAAVFRIMNEARRLAPPAEEGGVQLSGIVYKLIDEGFFVGQASAVRRLLDKAKDKGKKEVWSLRRLLDDMEENAHLMTRAHIFAAEGLEYDYQAVKNKFLAYCRKRDPAGQQAFAVPAHLDWESLVERHKEIDRLSGVAQCQRSPDDSVQPYWFTHLRNKLCVCKKLKAYVDKFIAHAAAPGSRAEIDADDLNITLGDFWDAHEAICKVVNFVGRYLLPEGGGAFLAIPQFNQFKYIERPLVTKENIPKLAEVWSKYKKETHDWTFWGLNEFEAETAKGEGA